MNYTHRLYGCSHAHSRFITENSIDFHWWNMKRCLCQELKEGLVEGAGWLNKRARIKTRVRLQSATVSNCGETCWCEKPHLTCSAATCLGIKGITHPKLTFYPFSPLCHRRPWWHYRIKKTKQNKKTPNMSPHCLCGVKQQCYHHVLTQNIRCRQEPHSCERAWDRWECDTASMLSPLCGKCYFSYVPHEYLYTSSSLSLSVR